MTDYYHVFIDKGTFSIVKQNFKPYQEHSAEKTLEKIRTILEKNLQYTRDLDDPWSKKKPEEIVQILRSLSTKISDGYHLKAAKIHFIIRLLFQIGKKVTSLSEQIQHIKAPDLTSIPSDCFNSVALYLNVKSLFRLMQTSKRIQLRCQSFFVSTIKTMGYQGFNFQESVGFFKRLKNLNLRNLNYFFSPNHSMRQFIYWYPVKPLSLLKDLGRNSAQNPDLVELRKFILGHREECTASEDLTRLQLEIAIEANDLEMLEFIKFYAPKVIADSYDFLKTCQTPEIFKFIVNWVTAKDAKSLDYFLSSPNKEIVSICLEKGCNIETSFCREGKQESLTPLIIALLHRRDAIAQMLLEAGANMDARYINGSTAIHFAAENGSEELLSLLFSKGVNINQPNDDGVTPLMFACMGVQGKPLNPTTIQMLLVNGADPFKKDHALKSALFYAQRREDPVVIELLEKAMNISTT